MSWALYLGFVLSALWAAPAPAADGAGAGPKADAALEAQVQRVASELRCLVCQNQTIADSNADLAQDLRREVRRMLAAGRSEAEVREFMVARYGDFILYRPPLKGATLLLWLGPFALLIGGIWTLRRIALHRQRAAVALSPDDAARLRALVSAREPDLR